MPSRVKASIPNNDLWLTDPSCYQIVAETKVEARWKLARAGLASIVILLHLVVLFVADVSEAIQQTQRLAFEPWRTLSMCIASHSGDALMCTVRNPSA